MDFSNDRILKDEFQKGNHEALVFLMDTYHQALCVYVHSLSNDYELAQDIVQNVFIKLWEDKHRIQSIKSIKSFLYKTVYNRFLNQWRKDKRMLAIEEKHLEAINMIVGNEYQDLLQRQIKLVKIEIQKLPPKCKETFLLSKQEGLTNIEIANFMNVSIRTVESQMNKAFRILREKLKDKVKPILFLLLGLDSNNKNFNYNLSSRA
ncbi:RNA polymerase sigma factor [Maribacter sp. 2304DJ31-5]|uniref:RNA polymerase sigma factor n=1 Tax=Maribacter sp. 2304DJ31-5 TaxID=3386273 RepID=UPI0039BC54F7